MSHKRIYASQRHKALPLPANREISALTKPQVYDKWAQDAAGIRAVERGDNVIAMFDVIGEDFWTGGGVTAKKVTAQLRAIGNRPVEVQINSAGGDMFEGIAIYNVLREHSQPITVKVMGMAASAASIIAMAGDDIQIGAASFIMIHNCWVMAMGNRHDLQETADYLAPFDQAMIDLYAARSGQSTADIAKWMDAETYMSGSQAIERGFANNLLSAEAMKTDAGAQAADRGLNDLRAMELSLVSSGNTRAEARERIEKLRTGNSSGADLIQPAASAGDFSGLAELLAELQRPL